MTKLQIRLIDMPGTVGKTLVLCDERGDPLPDQITCSVESVEGLASKVTASFAITGGDVSWAS